MLESGKRTNALGERNFGGLGATMRAKIPTSEFASFIARDWRAGCAAQSLSICDTPIRLTTDNASHAMKIAQNQWFAVHRRRRCMSATSLAESVDKLIKPISRADDFCLLSDPER